MSSMDPETTPAPATLKHTQLKKQLGLWEVYALATGATLSSGFFLLPGLAAAGAGAAMPIAYVLAGMVLLPGLFSMVELATAMPKAGGIYYFLDRSMGPLVGTIGGFGTWVSLILKSSFALIGIGAYLELFLPSVPMSPIAAGLAIVFGVINYFGAKKSGTFQILLLIGVMILLLWFCGVGIFQVEAAAFAGIFDAKASGVMSTAGLVIVSYMGLTKVASVAEEVENPERNLPLGMFMAFGTIIIVYVVGTSVMIGVAGVERLAANGGGLTPVADVAVIMGLPYGKLIMTVAAILAFSSVGNAGILSASRYPLAMGRDRLIPEVFGRVGKRGTPTVGIVTTVALIILFVTIFDPTKIAKLASAFQLVMFALACLAVIVMRESRIESYDPGYRSPLYPGIQILGILMPFMLIVEMGMLPVLFTTGLIFFGAMWFTYYAKDRVDREGAIFHVFERLGRQRDDRLDAELREVIKDRGPRAADPFDALFTGAKVLDIEGDIDFESLAFAAASELASDVPVSATDLAEGFLKGTRIGATPVSHGAALPHVRKEQIKEAHLLMARAPGGVRFDNVSQSAIREGDDTVRAVFFLIGPEGDPGRHLRILAQIARRVDQDAFMPEWLAAKGSTHLKEALFRNEQLLVIRLSDDTKCQELIGAEIKAIALPEGTLIAMIRREGEMIIPKGDTVLETGDRLTVLGRAEGISQLNLRFGGEAE
ncbi:MAG: amino acid permease [Longimicrobiales bacterium]|nr:amino acid permease [Longimicrobiales bacterium]